MLEMKRGRMILRWSTTGVLDAERTSAKPRDIAHARHQLSTSRA
jgi:hypothetical protein